MDGLEVTMLGTFSVKWNGEEIQISRNASPRFLQLLQLVWLRGEAGITREELLRYLYEGRSLKNPCNCLNNLIFQMRKMMAREGLPDAEYVVSSKGIYRPDPKIPLTVDVHQFQKAVQRARETKQNEQYRTAFELYAGNLLPAQGDTLWVEREGAPLKTAYEEAALFLLGHAGEEGDAELAGRIRSTAEGIAPGIMERAVSPADSARQTIPGGNYSEGMDRPVSYEEIGRVPGTGKGGMDGIEEVLSALLGDGKSVPAKPQGARCCSLQSLFDTCREMTAILDRTTCPSHLVLFTLTDYEGKPFRSERKRAERAALLKEKIALFLRQGDVYADYRDAQFLALIVGYDTPERKRLYRHIRTALRDEIGTKAKIEIKEQSLSELRQG